MDKGMAKNRERWLSQVRDDDDDDNDNDENELLFFRGVGS